MTALERPVLRPSSLELAFEWFHRIVAAYCLMFGVLYWIRLAGVYPGDLWRFDLMPPYWQVACVSLAVLFPFAAIGLWTVASWGPVIWFICAAAESVMYFGLPRLFGYRPALVAAHALVALAYIAFRVAMLFGQQNQGRR